MPELPAERQLQPINPSQIPRVSVDVDGDPEVRDFKIMKRDLEKYGFTDGCPGCEAARDNRQQRPHTDKCRERMRVFLLQDKHTKERVESAQLRLKRTRDQQGDVDMKSDQDQTREEGRSVESSVPAASIPPAGDTPGTGSADAIPVPGVTPSTALLPQSASTPAVDGAAGRQVAGPMSASEADKRLLDIERERRQAMGLPPRPEGPPSTGSANQGGVMDI